MDGAVVTMTGTMTRSVGRPYPGIRPFAHTDIDRFFGRSADATALAELWQANRLTIAVGATGSGKTSLLQAGVLPLVQGGRAEALPPGRISYGSTYPAAALPQHNPYTLALLRSWSPGEAATRLVGLTVREFVRRRAERHDGPILAVIDQAEELLADPSLRRLHRRGLLNDLAETVREESSLHLLLLLREPALEDFSRALGAGARYSVTPLSYEKALEAVKRPVKGADRKFEAGAAEELVTDLLTSYIVTADGKQQCVVTECVQPAFLQVVCVRLWESLPEDLKVITLRDVRARGNADSALAAHCSRTIAAVADEHDLPATRLRSWMIRTFVTELGTRGTAYEGMTDTAGMPNAVLRALEDRHLLSSQRRSGSRWYELLSERLIEPLRHAAEEQPPLVEPTGYLLAAERALTLGELDLAERYAEETLRTSPDGDFRLRAEAESLLGNLAHERGKPAEAEARYRVAAKLFEAVRDTGAVARQLAAVGQMLLAQGRLTDSVDELRAAVERLPNDLVVQAELGWALWQLGQTRAAEAVFTGILAVDAGNADALRGRGEILADLGEAREAMRDLGDTTSRDRPATRAARGLALAELGDHRAAARDIEAALAKAPRNGSVLLYAARAEALGGDQAAAAELAEHAINATDPPLPLHQREAALQLVGRSKDEK
jgi:tetratricopeptide (TPR) repeat protein